MMMMKFLILFISINKLLCVPIYQFQKSQLNHKMESYNYLEQYKMQQIYDALYQIFKNILKNSLSHIVVEENTSTTSTTEPYDLGEPYEDPVDIPEIIEEESKDGILENNKDDNDISAYIEEELENSVSEDNVNNVND